MSQHKNRRFWDRIAQRYAARPLKDVAAYEAMLAATASHLRPTDRVLEIGCGTGGTAITLAPKVAHFLATDFSAEMVRIAQAKPGADAVTFRVADARQALDDGPFDAICAFNVLHLVEDMPGLLACIHENLSPDGVLISKTWCFSDVKLWVRALFPVLRLFGVFPVVTQLGVAQLQQALLDAGFEIIEQRVFGAYPQNPYIVARKAGYLA
ncbi:bifunctional 2-polyprenyl-6-hydroxyphenol methylase/3-demethylubiquinol 3-O-methyltransferase UbiG [Roseinatronobacter sp.]|uniref:class I SAM-dependent methyltransferase n=1 Tax=Roseinatronobacter sp. TaxID=1945755 RepID=UPI0025D6FB8B|nr:class I SAM-dependent methyltransferase [Rhodobaca sp.]